LARSRKDPFKGRQFTAEVILWAVRWYLQFPISYRDLERMLADRGVAVDHTTIYRWIQAYAPELDKRVRPHLRPTTGSWRVDETLYLTAVSGRSRGMRPGQPERDVRPRVCDVDGALGLATAPSPRSDGIEGHPCGMSLHRQGGSAHGGASRRGERHGVARHRCIERQAGLRAPGR
jgi:hypothetical protein